MIESMDGCFVLISKSLQVQILSHHTFFASGDERWRAFLMTVVKVPKKHPWLVATGALPTSKVGAAACFIYMNSEEIHFTC